MSTPSDFSETPRDDSTPRRSTTAQQPAQPVDNAAVGTDVLLRAKQRLYFVTLIVIALAASMAFIVELVDAEQRDPVQQAINIPSIALCIGLCLTLFKIQMVPLVERIVAICITLYVLILDVSNLATSNESLDILLGYDPMVVMACVLIALAAPPRWSQYLTWGFFLVHTALAWAATLQSEQTLSIFWRLQSDLVVALTVAFISLLTTYSRVLGINRVHSESLHQLALTDQLTQLPNRRSMSEVLEQHPFASVVLIDIDDFKQLNDKFGHARGDEALQQVAMVLHDVFADSGSVGRWGGEEFLAVIPQGTIRQGHALAEEARLRIASVVFEPRITVSMGVTVHYPGEDVKVAVDRADSLLYDAKSDGKNRVAVDSNRQLPPSRHLQAAEPSHAPESKSVADVIGSAVAASRKVRTRPLKQAIWAPGTDPDSRTSQTDLIGTTGHQPKVVDLASATKMSPRQAGRVHSSELADDLLGTPPAPATKNDPQPDHDGPQDAPGGYFQH